MKTKLSLVKRIALVASTGSLFLVSPVLAQENQSAASGSVGLEVSSPVYEMTVRPGKTEPNLVKIKNVGNSTQTFYPQVLDFKSDNKSGTPIFLDENETNGSYSLSSWIRISKDPITLESGQSDARLFYVDVPANAEPGGHYAGILFSTEPPSTTGGNQIGLVSKVGSIVLVRVAGQATESANVTSFKTFNFDEKDKDKKIYKDKFNSAEVNFETIIENKGNVHLQPKGVITIKNMFGGTVATVDVNEISSNILPGSSRIFESTWKDPGFKAGLYTATITLNYGNPSQTITSQTSFWILPWTQIFLTIGIIVLVVILLVLFIRQYNRWVVSRALKNQDK